MFFCEVRSEFYLLDEEDATKLPKKSFTTTEIISLPF
jgi:hypothetical protein